MRHVVLLGDSIFDNGVYVTRGLAVHDHLQLALPSPWRSTLLAVDGSVTDDVHAQLAALPSGATHLIISCGGNDALGRLGMMQQTVATVNDAMRHLAAMRDTFRHSYRRMLERACATVGQVAVCTIYDTSPCIDHHILAALAFFNDVILREAARAGVPVLDLRLICSNAADYAGISPIEPSAVGGQKIAAGIVDLLAAHDYGNDRCVIHPGNGAAVAIHRSNDID